MERRHYLDCDDYEYSGFGTDDGYDAIKDANAELGLNHNHPNGFYQANLNGWLKKEKKIKGCK